MTIKEIELYNFRIYKGENTIDLTSDGKKNIFVVSGRNGFGKTTFLMSMVWCLYGKNMQEVDDLYKKEIVDQGGYSKYIVNSLNRLAKSEEDHNFHVSITFTNVSIPEVPCKEIVVKRSYNAKTSVAEELEVLIDGYPSELAKEVGQEIFIREFIMPIEIAKFFFDENNYGVPAMPPATAQAITKRQSCRAFRYNLFAQRTMQTQQKGFPLQSLTQTSSNNQQWSRYRNI